MRNEEQISQRTFRYSRLLILLFDDDDVRICQKRLENPSWSSWCQAWCDKVIMPRLLKCGALEEEGSFFVL